MQATLTPLAPYGVYVRALWSSVPDSTQLRECPASPVSAGAFPPFEEDLKDAIAAAIYGTVPWSARPAAVKFWEEEGHLEIYSADGKQFSYYVTQVCQLFRLTARRGRCNGEGVAKCKERKRNH